MDRKTLNVLFVNDDDLECDCSKITLADLNISHVGFKLSDIDKFDMIYYRGKKGEKILKSQYTKTGIILT